MPFGHAITRTAHMLIVIVFAVRIYMYRKCNQTSLSLPEPIISGVVNPRTEIELRLQEKSIEIPEHIIHITFIVQFTEEYWDVINWVMKQWEQTIHPLLQGMSFVQHFNYSTGEKLMFCLTVKYELWKPQQVLLLLILSSFPTKS